MNIVIVGHVDHGKSTIIGRMLADTGSLPQGKLQQIRDFCEKNSRPFEYAFLLDSLRDERAQGITIDVARVFFKTAKRSYVINDAPGHIEFLKNMVSGASRADAALLVIDGNEGIRENSRRHAYLLSMLGIRQLAVLVNKMDLLDRSESRFHSIVSEFSAHLQNIGLHASCYLPVVGNAGENITTRSEKMHWYQGPALLEVLDGFAESKPLSDVPFRMPVQDVYKFTAQGDTRRILAGTVESGTAKAGDELLFYPSGKKSRIRSVESFPGPGAAVLTSGTASGFTLEEQIYVARGEVASRADQLQLTANSRFKTSLFWLGKRPLHCGKDYFLKLGAARARARVENIIRVLDASSLEARHAAVAVERHEVAECVFRLSKLIAFDLEQLTPATSRFVLVDDYEIAGGGIIRESLPVDAATERGTRFHQRPLVFLLMRKHRVEAPDRRLEELLSEHGRAVYQLPSNTGPVSKELLLKLAEQARLLLDAGLVVLMPVFEAQQADVEYLARELPAGAFRSMSAQDEQALLDEILSATASNA
ncbi:MAG: 50S ribosome-binding GTPase [Deltaproteobacteria bacterium]|nr:50S ribosome-binding GTPase [Deltaproteobacteria bacterium]